MDWIANYNRWNVYCGWPSFECNCPDKVKLAATSQWQSLGNQYWGQYHIMSLTTTRRTWESALSASLWNTPNLGLGRFVITQECQLPSRGMGWAVVAQRAGLPFRRDLKILEKWAREQLYYKRSRGQGTALPEKEPGMGNSFTIKGTGDGGGSCTHISSVPLRQRKPPVYRAALTKAHLKVKEIY